MESHQNKRGKLPFVILNRGIKSIPVLNFDTTGYTTDSNWGRDIVLQVRLERMEESIFIFVVAFWLMDASLVVVHKPTLYTTFLFGECRHCRTFCNYCLWVSNDLATDSPLSLVLLSSTFISLFFPLLYPVLHPAIRVNTFKSSNLSFCIKVPCCSVSARLRSDQHDQYELPQG